MSQQKTDEKKECVVPLFDFKKGELSCITYMKCPFDLSHIVPKSKMIRHLKKYHNQNKVVVGMLGEEFDDHIFWCWDF